MKIYSALIATSAFIVILFTVYLTHAWNFSVNVVFYSSFFDAMLAVSITGLFLFFLPEKWQPFNEFEKLLLIVIWVLGGYSFAISIPTVLDRSLSFYILEKIDQRGGGIQKSGMVDMFVNEYIPEARLLDIRITEQLESKTIIDVDGCIKLTSRGKMVVKYSTFLRKNFLPKKRLLAGKYTDVLLDPFKMSSSKKMDYECQ